MLFINHSVTGRLTRGEKRNQGSATFDKRPSSSLRVSFQDYNSFPLHKLPLSHFLLLSLSKLKQVHVTSTSTTFLTIWLSRCQINFSQYGLIPLVPSSNQSVKIIWPFCSILPLLYYQFQRSNWYYPYRYSFIEFLDGVTRTGYSIINRHASPVHLRCLGKEHLSLFCGHFGE